MGKCTWMKYLEQEPLVARTKRHRPQPVPLTAGPREVRRGEQQDGHTSGPWCLLGPASPSRLLGRRGALWGQEEGRRAGSTSSPSWCPQSTQCGDLWVTDMKQRAGDMERRAGGKWGPSVIFRLSAYPPVDWGLAIHHNYRVTRPVTLQSQCEKIRWH